tara:strand:+ start:288 stop:557 length:270 start_codon:yes stop_codon:yes gene_type:complete
MGAGGKRPGAGRKSKSEEYKLIEKLDKFIDQQHVFEKLGELISSGQLKAIEIYLNYYFGKPTEKVDHTTDGEKINNPIVVFGKSDKPKS